MALSKKNKEDVIEEVTKLLGASKMTVVASYRGITVKQLQTLRGQAKDNQTVVKVIKNRLVIKALSGSEQYKSADSSALTDQLLYAFNSVDEVAPAHALAAFAKTTPSLQFVGAFTSDGRFIGSDEVKALASLPGKNVLIASLINTLNSPLNDVMSGLSGGLGGIMSGIEANAKPA